jgi:hypothetical protein
MKPLRLCPALRFCALAAPCLIGLRANAAPTFEWLESYQVKFNPIILAGGTVNSAANFGQNAPPVDQAITNTGANGDMGASTIFMRAFADARSGPILPGLNTDITEIVDFDRSFRLTDATNGWTVSVGGFLSGFRGVRPLGDLNPRAGVDVFARVGGDVLANASDRANNNGLTGTAGGLGSVDLPDGNYDYVGELKVTAIVSPALITTGQAFSDFISYPTGYGLSLTITATPRAANLPPLPAQGNPPPLPPPLLAQLPAETEFFISEDLPSEVPEPASALLLAPALALWRAPAA